MRILKAYTDVEMQGQYNATPMPQIQRGAGHHAEKPAQTGDVITISDEARDLMQNGAGSGISVTPHDATYDQRGNIMRQFDTLQGELRALGSQFIAETDDPRILAALRGMQSRVSSLRAQV